MFNYYSQWIDPSLYEKQRNFSTSGGKRSIDIGGNSLDFTLSQSQGSGDGSILMARPPQPTIPLQAFMSSQ